MAGAKLFMPPELVQPTLEVLQTQGLNLKPRHLVVGDDYEDAVMAAINALPSNDKVKEKSRIAITANPPRSQSARVEKVESYNEGSDDEPVQGEAWPPYLV